MSRRDAVEIAVFPGLNIVFSFIGALHMTGYNIQSQKIHAEKDRKQEIRRSENGNVFQNLIKIGVNLFGEKIYYFFYAADPEILSCMGQFF